MTREEAVTVTEYVMNAWTKPEWDEDHAANFVNALLSYDAALATQAVAAAHKTLNFRPSFAEFLTFYRLVKAEAASRQDRPRRAAKPSRLPEWVKRWTCARFFYERFGKEQDLRRFREMGDWGDPSVPLMPDDAWVKEAAAIGDREAMRAIQSGL